MRPNRQIFRTAWAMARAGARRFGGRASEYFAMSLSLSWESYLASDCSAQGEPSAAPPVDTMQNGVRRVLSAAIALSASCAMTALPAMAMRAPLASVMIAGAAGIAAGLVGAALAGIANRRRSTRAL